MQLYYIKIIGFVCILLKRNSLPVCLIVVVVKCLTPFKTFIILEDISVAQMKFKDKSINKCDDKGET